MHQWHAIKGASKFGRLGILALPRAFEFSLQKGCCISWFYMVLCLQNIARNQYSRSKMKSRVIAVAFCCIGVQLWQMGSWRCFDMLMFANQSGTPSTVFETNMFHDAINNSISWSSTEIRFDDRNRPKPEMWHHASKKNDTRMSAEWNR